MGGGKFGREGQEAHKIDSGLNVLVGKIRDTKDGLEADAFVRYKQGLISKVRLCELIALKIQEA